METTEGAERTPLSYKRNEVLGSLVPRAVFLHGENGAIVQHAGRRMNGKNSLTNGDWPWQFRRVRRDLAFIEGLVTANTYNRGED